MAKVLYKITNLIDGKYYIGQTSIKGFNYRMTAHKKRKDRPSLIHNAIQKYGEENFTFERLAILEDWMIDEAEQKAIIVFNSLKPNGYNLETGGNINKYHHPDTKKKMSELKKGKPSWCKGVPMKEGTKQKLREANKGKEPPNKGKKMSEEQKKILSEIKKGKPSSMKGREMSEESRKKMSISAKKRRASDETKKKLSEKAKLQWQRQRGEALCA